MHKKKTGCGITVLQRVFLISILTLLIVFLPTTSYADDSNKSAKLTGDSLSVDLEKRFVCAKGNIVLKYKEFVIYCDSLEINTISGEIFASGDVRFHDGEDMVQGESLIYNLMERTGALELGTAIIKDNHMKGPIYVTGSKFLTLPGKIQIEGGSLTTCDLESPHYRLEAGEIEIYIGDKMELRKLSYWEGNLCIFHWPYLVIPLREENRPEMPQIGYGTEEGWFIKTSYNYYKDPSFRGFLYLDYFTRLGLGLGVTHFYDFENLGRGSLYVYELMNKNTNHIQSDLKLSHELPMIFGTTCTLGFNYSNKMSLPGVPDIEVSGTARLGYSTDKGFADLLLERTRMTGTETSDEAGISLQSKWKASEGLSLSGDVRFFNRQVYGTGEGNDRYLNYKVEAIENFKLASVRVIAEQYVKSVERREKEKEGEVDPLPYETIGRAPEIIIEGYRLSLGRFPLEIQWTLGFGRYAERASVWEGTPVIRANKIHAGINTVEQTYDLGTAFKTTLSAGASFDRYTTGDERYVLQGVLASEAQILKDAITLSGKYDYCGVFGNTPFAFDKEERKGLLTGRLNLSKGIFTASVDCGYDFYTQTYENVTGGVRLSSGGLWSVDVSATYDPISFCMQDAVGRLEVDMEDKYFIKVGARYDFSAEALDRIESQVALEIFDTWGLEWRLIYGPSSKSGLPSVLRGDVAIVKDMHCREFRLSYNHTKKQVWLEYKIKAFPYDSLKFGVAEEGVLF
ncbi:MAG: LPS-assembly protein LptD [Firmicutes bacterium]|nr:LPS-assembly protein LptD [Bacillota bacterium]